MSFSENINWRARKQWTWCLHYQSLTGITKAFSQCYIHVNGVSIRLSVQRSNKYMYMYFDLHLGQPCLYDFVEKKQEKLPWFL